MAIYMDCSEKDSCVGWELGLDLKPLLHVETLWLMESLQVYNLIYVSSAVSWIWGRKWLCGQSWVCLEKLTPYGS